MEPDLRLRRCQHAERQDALHPLLQQDKLRSGSAAQLFCGSHRRAGQRLPGGFRQVRARQNEGRSQQLGHARPDQALLSKASLCADVFAPGSQWEALLFGLLLH